MPSSIEWIDQHLFWYTSNPNVSWWLRMGKHGRWVMIIPQFHHRWRSLYWLLMEFPMNDAPWWHDPNECRWPLSDNKHGTSWHFATSMFIKPLKNQVTQRVQIALNWTGHNLEFFKCLQEITIKYWMTLIFKTVAQLQHQVRIYHLVKCQHG